MLANFFARVEPVGEKRRRENMSVLNSSECRVGNHYLLKCPGFGLLVASLKARAVFHIPLRLMRTVPGPIAVILTN